MQTQLDQARSYLEKKDHTNAVELCRTLLGQEPSPELCVVLLDILAQALRMGNDLPKAEKVTQSLLSLLEASFGKDHPQQVPVLQNLALIQSQQGLHTEAIKNAQNAVYILEHSPQTAPFKQTVSLPDVLITLSSTYYDARDLENAKAHIERALLLWETKLGRTCFGVSTCLNNLGRIYEHQNNFETALMCHAEAVNIRRQLCGKSEDTAFCLGNYGGALASYGKFQEAIFILQEALDIYDSLGIKNTPYVQAHQQNLDICMRAVRNTITT